jgi:hypothetical protein
MTKKYIGISRREFIVRFFDLWNILQKEEYRLRTKEIAILAEFLLLPDKFKYSRFSTQARKYVLRTVNESGWNLSQQGLAQLIKSLTDKGIVKLDIDGVKSVTSKLDILADKNKTEYDLKFLFQIDNAK